MSDENECPFEVGQWVTDGERMGRIFEGEKPFVLVWPGEAHDDVYWPPAIDWSRWTAFDPELVHRLHAQLWSVGEYRARAEAAEARVKEFEAALEAIASEAQGKAEDMALEALRGAVAEEME